MADISLNRFPLPASERGHALRRLAVERIGALQDGWTRWRRYRRTLDELRGLSDRELNDLGIARSAIRGIALDDAYGR